VAQGVGCQASHPGGEAGVGGSSTCREGRRDGWKSGSKGGWQAPAASCAPPPAQAVGRDVVRQLLALLLLALWRLQLLPAYPTEGAAEP